MESRRLGNSGLQVSPIAIGSWLTFGEAVDSSATRELVAQAIDLGVCFFDTADVYANGAAEAALGAALRASDRQRLVIGTKCFFPTSEAPNDRGLSRKHLFESVENSLRRLDTDYLDLHQCHRYDPDTPLEETVRAYEDLIHQGKLLYWGTSLWTAKQIRAACAIADRTGGFRPVSNQPAYSILRREIEGDLLPGCRELGVDQVVFSPLAQGVLTGKYSGGQAPTGSRGSDPRLGRFMQRYLTPETLERVDALTPIAAEVGVPLATFALAWCLRDPSVSSVITAATHVRQLEQNCDAARVVIPEEIARRVDALFPPATTALPPDPDTP